MGEISKTEANNFLTYKQTFTTYINIIKIYGKDS
jgi:hypothetical protein